MSDVEIVKDSLPGFNGSAALVRRGSDYFVVSSIGTAFDTGRPETMAFRADDSGNITSWMDVAGGTYATRESVIADLEAGRDRDENTEDDL